MFCCDIAQSNRLVNLRSPSVQINLYCALGFYFPLPAYQVARGEYPTEKKVDSLVLHLPVQFHLFSGGKRGRRGRKKTEYCCKSPTLFYCQVVGFLVCYLKGMGSRTQADAWSAGGAEAVAEGGPVAGLAEGLTLE